ncbi:MAG: queuosine precursor transporter [Flavobacteriales bacterium]
MDNKKKDAAILLFTILSGIFIASLVACNLIFKKFFSYTYIESQDFYMVVSVGIIAYPVTFLATDLISELFGKKRANQVVVSGVVVSLLVLLLVTISDYVSAVSFSPVNDETFSHVFGNTGAAITSSMMAYLIAQFIDVRVFHFIKRRTNGRMLWLRNNVSTITSQLIDTSVVLAVLCQAGELAWKDFGALLLAGFIFKVVVALLDTPIIYAVVGWARTYFSIEPFEEIEF